jgi:uncharacterized protein (TIGR01777 family)
MFIAIAGSSGFVGRRLKKAFQEKNVRVIEIRRSDFTLSDQELALKLNGARVIINLAGAPIVKKWTDLYKKELVDSRILTTRKLRNVIPMMEEKPQLLIATSAVGIYPDGKLFSEDDRAFSPNFLSKLCRDWEDEALLGEKDYRIAIFRLGVVLDSKEGAFPKMRKPFSLGFGGKLGNGRQGFSWIHIQDLINAYFFVIENTDCAGIYNLGSPAPVTNAIFTEILAKKLRRPSFFPVPAFVLQLLYGEGSMALTKGQMVFPKRLLEAGFSFRFPDLESALNDILRK